MRDIGRYLYFKPDEVEVDLTEPEEPEKQILVAGVGNAWLQDDAFGGECARRLEAEGVPSGRDASWTSAPAGWTSPTRSCAATTRWSCSTPPARAASPGRSTSWSPSSRSSRASIEDGEAHRPARHGPADRAALRQRHRRLAGQGRGHRLRARRGRRRRARPDAARRRRGRPARIDAGARDDRRAARPTPRLRERCADARAVRSRSAVVDTAVRHAAGRRVTVVSVRLGRLRQVVPDSLEFSFGIVARDTVCEGARLEQELVPARAALRRRASTSGRSTLPAFRCPTCATARTSTSLSGEELEVESIEVDEEDAACIA